MRITRTHAAAISIAALAATAVCLADPVTPASCIITNLRDVADSALYANDVSYYQGDYISFSNSVMFTDSTGTVTQDLTDCTITVTLGNASVSNTATGYIINASAGLWGAEVVVPAADPCYIEVGVSNVFNYTYPREKIRTRAKLP